MEARSLLKRIIYCGVLLAAGLLVAAALGEVLVRVFHPRTEVIAWQEFHPRYGSYHKKNYAGALRFPGTDAVMTVRTNALGLRDREYDFSDDTARRVLLVGDSFTFGYGLNEESTFGAKLEDALNERLGKTFVINTGVSNWGPAQEFLFARDHFRLFRPDLVVFTFCGNDKGDIDWFQRMSRQGFEGSFSFPGKRFLKRHSHLCRYLGERWAVWKAVGAQDRKTAEAGGQQGGVFVDEQTASAYTEQDWRETLDFIRAFHSDYLAFNPDGVMLVQATAPWDATIRERLRSLDNGDDLLFVDLYPETRDLPAGQRRLPHDTHWSERMHDLAAAALVRTIESRGLLDRR